MIRIDHDGDDEEHMTVGTQHTLGTVKSDTAKTVHEYTVHNESEFESEHGLGMIMILPK
jgi:hypothetical protein